jgi:precorrin-6B methylase 2
MMQKDELGIDRLEKVVKETAQAIRTGNLAIMGELASRTDAALAEIGSETDAARIEALLSSAQHNAVALEAAGRGVRAARRRLTEILSVRAGVQTYDNAGNTQKIGGPLGSFKTRL